MVNQWLISALSRLLPGCCPLCDNPLAAGEYLCAPCHAALPRLPHTCRRCGLPLPPAADDQHHCGVCQTTPPAFDQLISACHYAPPVTHLITAYKFQQQLHHARLFAQMIRTAVHDAAQTLPEIIVPVPLHPARQRQRGYNQALEIARMLSRWLAIPLEYNALLRKRATTPQSELDAGARVKNVRGAFALRRSLPYRRVVLLDDVVTTGNTVNEIARVLKQSGIEHVAVWCIARAADYSCC